MTSDSITKSMWWILPGQLAGMRKPESEDLDTLKAKGIGAIVSVMDDPSNLDWVESFRAFVEEQMAVGNAVAVHCSSGRRRTATFLGAFLILTGASYDKAVGAIAGANPAVEMRTAQLDFLKTLADE